MRIPRHTRRAFTLIEALAAIAVTVIVIPVLLQGFNIAGNVASYTRQMADATLLGQSVMDELVSSGDWQNNASPGEQKIGPTVYDVEVSVEQWDNEVNVQQLTVTVHWSHRGLAHAVALTTVVYVPDTSTQGTTSLLGGTP